MLRPRYSLLTLLVLTALVAGGVKLWYGPHHVVEWTESDTEVEYTYTRHWDGSRNIQGPWVRRAYINQNISLTQIQYFQHGKGIPKFFFIGVEPDGSIFENDFSDMDKLFAVQLPDEEQQRWKENVDRERRKINTFQHGSGIRKPTSSENQ